MRQLAEAVTADLEGEPELLVDGPLAHDLAFRDWLDPVPDAVESEPGALADHGVMDMLDALRRPRVDLAGGGAFLDRADAGAGGGRCEHRAGPFAGGGAEGEHCRRARVAAAAAAAGAWRADRGRFRADAEARPRHAGAGAARVLPRRERRGASGRGGRPWACSRSRGGATGCRWPRCCHELSDLRQRERSEVPALLFAPLCRYRSGPLAARGLRHTGRGGGR